MRRALLLCSFLAVWLALSAPVRAEGVEILPGQKLRGSIAGPEEVHIFRFEAAEGDSLGFLVKTRKAGGLDPLVRLFSPRVEIFVPGQFYGRVS